MAQRRMCWYLLAALAVLAAATTAAGAVERQAAKAATADSSTLVEAVPDDAATFDPLFATTPRSTAIIMNSYEPLMGYGLRSLGNETSIWDSRKLRGMSLVSSRVGKDGLTWTLTVRKGVKFPDGTAIDAEAVKFMFDRNFGVKGSGGAFMYSFMGKIPSLDAVEVTGKYTLQVKTSVPNPLLPRIFALSNSTPIQQSILEREGGGDPYASKWVARNTAGAGPYQLKSWRPGSEIVLTANPNYWRGAPSIKTVQIRVVPSSANRMLLLRRGVVDVIEKLSAEEIQSLSRAPGIKIVSVPSTNTTQLIMNTTQAPFTDVRVRRAVAYAIPYKDIIRSIYFGRARGSTGPVPVGFPLRVAKGYAYSTQNLEKARELLRQARKSSGLSLALELDSGSADHEAVAVLVRDALQKIGVRVSIQKLTPAVFAERRAKRDLTFFLNDSLWWVDDPSYALGLGYTCKAFFNYGLYCNEAVDRLIAQAGQTLDVKRRAALYAKAQRQIVADAPMAWIAQPNFNLAMRSNVTGYAHFNDEMVRFAYFKKR